MSLTDVLARVNSIQEKLEIHAEAMAPAKKKTSEFTQALLSAQKNARRQAQMQMMQQQQGMPGMYPGQYPPQGGQIPGMYGQMPGMQGMMGMPSAAPTGSGSATMPSPEILNLFQTSARKHGVPLEFALAVGKAESGFRPDAISPAGAQGIMQLMPATAAGFGVTNSFDPAQNIDAGMRFLKNLLAKFNGDMKLAAAGYNAGPNAVTRFGGVPPYSETQAYVQKVLNNVRDYAGHTMSMPTGLPSQLS